MNGNCSQVASRMAPPAAIIMVFAGLIPQNRSVVLARSGNMLACGPFCNHHNHSKIYRMPDDLKAFFDAPRTPKQRQYG